MASVAAEGVRQGRLCLWDGSSGGLDTKAAKMRGASSPREWRGSQRPSLPRSCRTFLRGPAAPPRRVPVALRGLMDSFPTGGRGLCLLRGTPGQDSGDTGQVNEFPAPPRIHVWHPHPSRARGARNKKWGAGCVCACGSAAGPSPAPTAPALHTHLQEPQARRPCRGWGGCGGPLAVSAGFPGCPRTPRCLRANPRPCVGQGLGPQCLACIGGRSRLGLFHSEALVS